MGKGKIIGWTIGIIIIVLLIIGFLFFNTGIFGRGSVQLRCRTASDIDFNCLEKFNTLDKCVEDSRFGEFKDDNFVESSILCVGGSSHIDLDTGERIDLENQPSQDCITENGDLTFSRFSESQLESCRK